MIDLIFFVILFILGLLGGLLSVLLGLGVAIFMIPFLLYVPTIIGVNFFEMKQIAAISMVQVFFASVSGVIIHNKNRFVSASILLHMGLPNAAGNLFESIVSLNTCMVIYY